MSGSSKIYEIPPPPVPTLEWKGDVEGYLELIDQTQLPLKLEILECRDVKTVWQAIKRLSVRGAPAIGVSAAYGMVIGLQNVIDVLNRNLSNDSKRSLTIWLAVDQLQ